MTPQKGSTYQHVQTVASDTWVINHGLKVYPAVDVYVVVSGSDTRILPSSVQYISADTCALVFSQPFTGTATVV